MNLAVSVLILLQASYFAPCFLAKRFACLHLLSIRNLREFPLRLSNEKKELRAKCLEESRTQLQNCLGSTDHLRGISNEDFLGPADIFPLMEAQTFTSNMNQSGPPEPRGPFHHSASIWVHSGFILSLRRLWLVMDQRSIMDAARAPWCAYCSTIFFGFLPLISFCILSPCPVMSSHLCFAILSIFPTLHLFPIFTFLSDSPI
jgi:hypothetical protein